MRKTVTSFDWSSGYTKTRRLSRSFKTLAEAERFAQSKTNAEIYIRKNLYRVEWTKKTVENP